MGGNIGRLAVQIEYYNMYTRLNNHCRLMEQMTFNIKSMY